VLVVNPRSGGGRARAAAPAVSEALSRAGYQVELRETAAPGGAESLGAGARDADVVVTLGGDGTVSEVVNGVLGREDWPANLTVTPLPLGTGNSFVRHFGPASGDWRSALTGFLEGKRRRVDAARATWREGPHPRRRWFVNVFGTGFMAQVADVTNRRLKVLGGRGYIAGVFWQLARLASPPTRLSLDGARRLESDERLTLVAVCNTQWTGEKMWIAPRADASDGLLDVVTLGPVTRLELVRIFPRIFDGTHLMHPAVRSYRAARVEVEPSFAGPLLLDGEVMGTTPVQIEVVPGAIQIGL
jgi:diacylglycerol kinase (ATP)